jgi:hypothetical protein
MAHATPETLTDQAAAHVRGRPDYPVALESWLRHELGLGVGKVAVDLGSGTGKFLPRCLQPEPILLRSNRWTPCGRI